MKRTLLLLFLFCYQLASGQNFLVSVDGSPVSNNDTVVKTVAGLSGWYNEVTDIEIENTSLQDLIINIIQDDTNVIPPAIVYIGCGAFGCIPPGVNNPNIYFQVNAGQNLLFTSPGFECSGGGCSGSHTVSYTIFDQSGISNGITFFIRYEIPVSVGLQTSGSDPLITVNPNPASSFFTIRSNQKFRNIEVYDVLGNLVLRTSSCIPGNCNIDVNGLTEGIYLLKVHFEENTLVQRVLVNR
jgi:hypothetical protein